MNLMLDVETITLIISAMNISLGLIEYFWAKKNRISIYNTSESLINISMLLGNTLLNTLTASYVFFLFQEIYRYSFFKIPSNFFTFSILFLAIDFVIYWFHRIIHESKYLFFIHATHHSSNNLNMTHACRVSWLNIMVSLLPVLPLGLLGFQPLLILSAIALHQVGAGWNHTPMIKKMGFLDKIIATPSVHRVHHGCNDIYINKNYGKVFIIWDRIFKTYQPETEEVRYGVSPNLIQYNPYLIQYGMLWDLIRFKKNKV